MQLRDHLKTATAESHSRLDNALRNFDPFGHSQRYQTFLSLMLQLHIRCRESLDYVEVEARIPSRDVPLEELISSDLQTLGVSELPAECTRAADSERLSKTPESMWGEAYVMEGSAMGGKMMFRQAELSLPIEYGREYLRQLSIDAGDRWKVFVTALKSTETRSLDNDEVVTAAKNVFEDAYLMFNELKKSVNAQ